MPTYEYHCEACGKRFEKFQPITARPIRKCPACGRNRVRRLIGPGAGVIFKGSGFYQTDYRSDAYRQAAQKDKPSEAATPPVPSTSSAPPSAGAAPQSPPGKDRPPGPRKGRKK
jgi:putative FmdB family regulatory protein